MAKNITVKIGDQLQNFQGVEFLKLQTVGSQGDTSFVDQDSVSVLPFTFKFDANGQHNEENIALYQKYKNCVERGLSVNTYINWEGALYPASSIPELNKIYAYTDIGPLDIIEITFGETVQNNIIEVIDTVFDEEKGNPASQQAIAEWVKKYVSKNGGGGAVTDEQIASAVEAYFEENPIEFTETDPTVPSWAKQKNKPSYTASEVGALPSTYTPPDQTAEQVGADPKGTADSKVSAHNTSNASHNDIRLLIESLTTRLNTLANSTDEDLDQLSEIVAYIKSNKELIEGITTNKVSVSDIIDNLTTNVASKPLSAAQGVALKALIDAITVPTKLSQLSGDSTHRTVTDAEKTAWNAKSNFSGAYDDLTGKPTIPTVPTNVSAFDNDAGYIKDEELEEAVDSALEFAKGSGEFDGDRGFSILRVTTALSSYTTTTGGFTPKYRIALSTVLSESGASEVRVGDTILRNYYTYHVGYVNDSYVYVGAYASIRGAAGADYVLTEADKEEIAGMVEVNTTSLFNIADAICPPNQLAADGSTFGDYNEETEELYTGEGCSRGSDFNAFTVTHTDIYGYIDNVRAKYPFYITKEIMGKDASGTIDIPRYIMSGCYYRAYYKENYPKMYAWKNGNTVLYSLSISPRIGDSMYSTAYIGTVKGVVSAVDNVSQTRTVGGVVYTKDEASNVEPTLVYIRPTALSSHSAGADFGIYDVNKKTIGSLSNLKSAISSAATAAGVSYPTKMNEQIQSGVIYDNNGVNYIRYPFGDRFEDMSEPIKIVIGCNEHGTGSDEAEPSICCARLINDLATGTDNKMLNWLRKNAIVIAVPIINPYGYDKHKGGYVVGSSYYNANNININRNYDTIGWVHDTSEYTAATNDTTGHSPCGAYAGSENETQYIMNTIALGDVAVSYHTIGATTDLLCAYQFNGYATQNPNTVNTPAYITKKMNDIAAVMRSHYGWQFVPYGEDFPDEAAKSLSFITQAGCTGGLIEMCTLERGRNEINSGNHTALVLEACYSEMLMTLYSFINDYNQTIRI